ncbi:hypothetical protein TI04_07910 [Achromatium sp. WMS2]|nr:hypothetical protein TI04_07910 [Achromatium sp. WMS2]
MLNFTKNYFQLFELPEIFDIDQTILTQRYLNLQQAIHPDKYANASDQERRLAVQQSGLLNEALRILKHPVTRANYLLSIRGIAMDIQQNTINDHEFLLQQMQLQEDLTEITTQSDPYPAIAELKAKTRQQIDKWIKVFKQTIDQGELLAARDAVYKLEFLQRFMNSVDHCEQRLDESL